MRAYASDGDLHGDRRQYHGGLGHGCGNYYTDVAGNLGSSGTDTAPVDTRNPTVCVDIVDASLNDSDNSSR